MAFHLNPANQAAQFENPGDLNKCTTFLKDHLEHDDYIAARISFLHYKGRRNEYSSEILWEKEYILGLCRYCRSRARCFRAETTIYTSELASLRAILFLHEATLKSPPNPPLYHETRTLKQTIMADCWPYGGAHICILSVPALGLHALIEV
jgi:hypothetical protein